MFELGIIFAFAVALIKGFQSIVQREDALVTDEFVTAFSSRLFGIPILFAAILYTGIPDLGTNYFLMAVPVSLVIAGTSILIAKAFKESDASIVTPMFAISPILVLFTSFFILGEVPSPKGVVGVLMIAFGAYTLKLEESHGLLEPFKQLWVERGVQLITVVILIYSITSNLDKLGVQASSPVMWPLTVYTLSTLFMLPIMMKKSPDWKSKMRDDWKLLALLGVFGGVSIIFQMAAIELTLVSYVVSIKRLSIPLTVVLGYFMLNEKDGFKERIIGSMIMAVGALLISL